MFELHLLESGISGNKELAEIEIYWSLNSTYWNLVFQEDSPAGYGDSQSRLNSTYWNLVFQVVRNQAGRDLRLRLNSTYWNLVFQVIKDYAEAVKAHGFELHLLESGISGWRNSIPFHNKIIRLNSTYWNLVFQGLALQKLI